MLGRAKAPSACGPRCVVRLAGGLLRTGQAVCGWRLRLSRDGSPCRATTEPRPPTPGREERTTAPSHLPPRWPPPCPLLCGVHAPGRGHTATPTAQARGWGPPASLCASKVPTRPWMWDFRSRVCCQPACEFVCACTRRVSACAWSVCVCDLGGVPAVGLALLGPHPIWPVCIPVPHQAECGPNQSQA